MFNLTRQGILSILYYNYTIVIYFLEYTMVGFFFVSFEKFYSKTLFYMLSGDIYLNGELIKWYQPLQTLYGIFVSLFVCLFVLQQKTKPIEKYQQGCKWRTNEDWGAAYEEEKSCVLCTATPPCGCDLISLQPGSTQMGNHLRLASARVGGKVVPVACSCRQLQPVSQCSRWDGSGVRPRQRKRFRQRVGRETSWGGGGPGLVLVTSGVKMAGLTFMTRWNPMELCKRNSGWA